MSGEEWDDDDDLPTAPIPMHERTWRHPSELGPPPMPTLVHQGPVFGRTALIGAGVVGVALVAGLFQLLTPRSGTPVSSEGTQSLTSRSSAALTARPALTPRSTSAAVLTTTVVDRPVVTPVRSSEARTTDVGPVATNSVSTLMLLTAKRAAVPIGDGRRAVTTAGSLATNQSVDVQLGDGTSAKATVVSVDQSANVAVLALDSPADGAPVSMAGDEPHDGDQVTVGCQNATPAVLVATDDGMVVDADSPVDEGAPVLDAQGALVGLASTADDGLVHLVSIPDGAAAPGTVVPDPPDVSLGITLDGSPGRELVVVEVDEGSPAADAGIEPGDRLIAIGDSALETVDDLWHALVAYDPGDVVGIGVQRDTAMLTLTVTLAALTS